MKKRIKLYLAASAKAVQIKVQRKNARKIARMINASVHEVITL